MPIPCNCCSTNLTRCFQQQVPVICNDPPVLVAQSQQSPIPATTLVQGQAGVGIANPPLSSTADNNTAGASFSGFNGDAPNAIIDYTYGVIQDRVLAIRLWNNGGAVLTDADGLGPTTIVELFDNLGVSIFGPTNLVAGNGGAIFSTNVAGLPGLNGVRRMRLTNVVGIPGGSNPGPLWRNISLFEAYLATITWDCPPNQVVATVNGLNAGLAIGAGTLTQTNGPHTLTFDSPTAFTGTIVTNNPGNFSTLAVTNGTVVTLTGNAVNQFVVNYTFPVDISAAEPAFGMLCDGVVKWYNAAGVEVNASLLVDCI